MKKRLISILLVLAMMLSILSSTALAAVKDLAGNTDSENKAILGQLSKLTGGSSDEAYTLLQNLGLLDTNGNLNVSQSVELDGKSMSLDEVIALLDDPGTDLSRIAEVDSTPIALGDLKTIIQIEKELARIKEKYFSGKAFTSEQLAQLENLADQIRSEGITATLPGTQASGLILTITPDASNPASITYSGKNPITLKYNLNLSGTMPQSGTVSFYWKRVLGFMPSDFFSAKLELKSSAYNQIKYVQEGQAFSFGPDPAAVLIVNDASQFSGTLTITIGSGSKTLAEMLGCNVSGTLSGFMEFYGGDGLAFSDGSTQGELCTLPVTVSKPAAFEYGGLSWMTSMTGVSNYDKGMTEYPDLGYDEYANPRWNLIDFGNSTMLNNHACVNNTAEEIYAGGSSKYQVDASLFLYDTNLSNSGYMKNALPVGYDGGSPSNRLTTLGYKWNGYELNLTSNPLQTVVGGTPYIMVGTNTSATSQTVSIVMESSNGRAPLTLNTVWPGNPIFCRDFTGTTSDFYFTGAGKQRTVSSSISVYDDAAPSLTSITIPAGTYSSGQYVPILLTFSEPVKASGLSLTINGDVIKASELMIDTTGRTAAAMYRVRAVDATMMSISNVTNLEDLTGHITATADNGGSGWSFPGVTLESTFMKNAVASVSASPATVQPTDLANGVTVTLTLDQAEGYRTKYADYNTSKGNAPFAVKLTNQTTGVSRTLNTSLSESGGMVSATVKITDFAPAATDEPYQAEIIAYENASDTTGTLVIGKSASFTVKAVTFVNGVTVTYPSGDKTELSLSDAYRPKLGVSFTGSPSFTSGGWTSSNAAVATIDANGQVVLTGTAVGKVSFTFNADNGGLTDPVGTHIKSCTSKEYSVIVGDSPALVIPAEANRIVARQNGQAQVRWSSNSGFFASGNFKFTIELFKGNFTEPQLSGKTPVYMATAEKSANSLTIPENTLSTLSVNDAPAYTVRVSMPHPILATERLSAVCYIVVNPAAAVVRLERPAGGLYMLDSGKANISWSIDNYTGGATAGDLRIERISTQNGEDMKSTVTEQPISSQTGSYTLTPANVSNLKDTYMVTLRAKNTADEGYSSDSFPLYVYNADALKLEVNGHKVTKLTLDNESTVSGVLPTDTGDILALREELALIEYIGINYNDYSWSQLKDGIRWATSNTNTVSVNYRQGGLYEDISKFSMGTYLPETKMALSSVTDGTATITATHANTGMSASVTVDVHTLREKFYLFQLTPMQKTELSYTDGKGAKKAVYTNDDGVLALYEPNGIASDVHLKSADGNGSVWLGTIYQNSVLSGERDKTRLQLYPLNTFKLRQAAKAEINLKKPDGSPYSSRLTLRGGVYKNGGYCQAAEMLGNTIPDSAHPLKDGKESQTVTVGPDGKLTVYMDSTQFWSAEKSESDTAGKTLKSADNLQYIFELTDINGYYPLLVYSNGNLTLGDIVRNAGSIISLESYTGSPRSFVSNQTMDYGLSGDRLIDVRRSTGHIGPNDPYPEVKLLTTVMLWGQDAQKAYKLELCDEYGYIPAAQSSQVITYPFSSIPVTRNTLIMSHDTITKSGWVPAGKDIGLRTRLSQEGVMLMELPVSPRVTDLTQVPKLKSSENITGMMLDLQSKSGVKKGPGMSDENKIINGLMKLMGNLNGPVNGSSFKMLITPGDDNAVFNAFIWAGYNSLGLDDVDYDQNGLAFDYKLAESNLTSAPNLNDLTDMAKGSYDPEKTYNDAKTNQQNGKGNSSTDLSGQLEGYFEAQIQYNFEKGKWEIYVLGGGFTAGFGMSYTYNINAQAGPIPLTATFNVGGGLQIDFKAAIRYSEQNGLKWATTVTGNSVNDYLTALRINAYVNAFGGLGFDYSVVALKIGVFGKVTFDNQNKFLSRTYLEDPSMRQLNGQALKLSGEVGIKFVAQFLFISFEFILASGSLSTTFKFNDWDTIDNYWNNTGSGLKRMALTAKAAGGGLTPVSCSATLQSREYLDRFARTWGSEKRRMALFSVDSINALETLQANAYPYALPLVSDDGQLLLYAFDNNSADISDTRIYATSLSGGSYPQGTEIVAPSGFDGYGDSGLSLAGDAGFATAAWVRQSASIPGKAAGQTISGAEQALLMNGTEIVAAVYNGVKWIATRLTDNATPDLAPVVATNGSKAIIAWRSVYSGDSDDLINFSQHDYILYSIYNSGSWSAPKQLYNGTSGAVKGIDAAILPDGTAAVTYTLDTDSTDSSSTDYEIGYAIVNAAGEPSFSAIITQDKWLDENPQIIAVKFAKDDVRFVLGWHSIRDGLSDIRLAAIDGGGALSNSFIESIAQAASGNAVDINGNFRFVRFNGACNDIDNLSIIWPESKVNDAGETDHGILRAVKFVKNGTDISISAALDVAELPLRTLLDHFDAYVASDDGKTVKAVIQGSEYKNIDLSDPNTYTTYKDLNGNDIYVANEEVKLFTATAAYQNRVRLNALAADYVNLNLNTLTPIQFTVFNAGMDAIDSVRVEIEGSITTFDTLGLYPNESKTLTCWYPVGGTIKNLDYTLTSDFGGTSDMLTGTVYLDYPDVGISQLKVVSEDEGIRTLQLTLYNSSAATLSGGKKRSMRLGFYDDALFKKIQTVSCNTAGVTVNADKTLSISGEDALKLIDEGAFTFEVSFDLGRYVTDASFVEIPDSGFRLYANAWAEETNGSNTAILPEYSRSNNSESVLFESALTRSGQLVSLAVEQGLSGNNKTTANVSLRNNSLRARTSGNLIVSLLDTGGNVLEQQQSYTGNNSSFIALGGEETASRTFTFGKIGGRVTAAYGDLTLASNNAQLAALSFEGLAVRLSDFIPDSKGRYVCTAPDSKISSTLVSYMTEDPGAAVTINGQAANGSTKVSLPKGSTAIKLEVTAKNGTTKQSYILSVNSAITPDNSDNFSSSGNSTATNPSYSTITVAATENGSVSVSPAKAIAGASVSISVAPDNGYALDDLTVTDKSGAKVALSKAGDSKYTFTMPGSDVTVTASFWKKPFSDVRETDWYYNAAKYASKHGLMDGVGNGLFAPNAIMTRAMVVTILYRLDGKPAVIGANPFNDVAKDSWYMDAVTWAAKNGIVSGYSHGRFGPDDKITREQMAEILYNYAKYKGITPTGTLSVELTYPDRGKISPWAREAAMYCQLKDFIQGDGKGNFNPLSGTRRCEAAVILMRFIEAMK